MAKEKKEKRSAVRDVKTMEATIHMHKRLHGNVGFKKRAPRAIKEIKKFAEKLMGTKDNRVDSLLNKHVWSQGIRNVPYRLRIRFERLRNEDDDAAEKLYTLCKVVKFKRADFKGATTKTVEDDDE
eukprot:m.428944 g.428944  ORF g.428944 m.428944 type:complete len:126 (-) comp16916_c0_seq1:26-403(-)